MLLIDDLLLAPFKGWNLSRFAGVSEVGARRRNPERSRGISKERGADHAAY